MSKRKIDQVIGQFNDDDIPAAKINPTLEYNEESTTSVEIKMEHTLIKLEPYEISEMNDKFLSTPAIKSIGVQTDYVYETNETKCNRDELYSVNSSSAVPEDNINFLNDEEGNIISDIPIVSNPSENSQLDELLQTFNLNKVKPYLTKAEITFDSLRYLSKEDIKEAIPPIGLRACFREKLFAWRKAEYGIDDGTFSDTIAEKVVSWLQNESNIDTKSSSCSTPVKNSKSSKGLERILKKSPKGRSIILLYKQNNSLTDSLRAELINIILEDTFHHETKLSSEDFTKIVDEIVKIFPNEIREYYFIPRSKNTNPGGKLWDKYRNQKSKRERLSVKIKDNLDASNSLSISPLVVTELDESISLSLKVELSRDLSNWDEVKDKWQRTFLLRQKELKSSTSNYEFLSNWPPYANKRSEDLINIDFELLQPNKSKLLFSKWQGFKQKIVNYYNLYIKDKRSREILTNSKDITEQNSLDFIYTMLLNAVILPTARFLDKAGKNVKKISIPDANESFIVHLTSINYYELVISELRNKYYNRSLTVQPFLIVVGQSIYNLDKFYVYFNKTLLQFDYFLQSLDICFKIFYTLSLEYPKGCQGPWHFIQEYFYEAKPASDGNLSSICSLLNFLKTKKIY